MILCETCKHWNQNPDNGEWDHKQDPDEDFGVCQMMDGRTAQARVMLRWVRSAPPPSGWLETYKTFGCTLWESK